MYADDIILLSPSVIGLQCMLDICFEYGAKQNITFNSKKSVCLMVGVRDSDVKCNMFLGGNELLWVSKLKYLGVYFIAKRDLVVDVIPNVPICSIFQEHFMDTVIVMRLITCYCSFCVLLQ
jgi:Reverse transcriptase (RNA-dependent DNA polymerase)